MEKKETNKQNREEKKMGVEFHQRGNGWLPKAERNVEMVRTQDQQ